MTELRRIIDERNRKLVEAFNAGDIVLWKQDDGRWGWHVDIWNTRP